MKLKRESSFKNLKDTKIPKDIEEIK